MRRRCVLAIGLASNLGLLGWFKYYGFFASEVASVFGGGSSGAIDIALPLGISFFVFQSLSAVVDAYRNPGGSPPSLLRFATYISFFPQLVAGPIVRYSEIEAYLACRVMSLDNFVLGIKRFVLGLAKKVLIANQVALFADTVFAQPVDQIGFFDAWLGCAAYAIQILYDFSGYSDMAIGHGLMFGIRLPENFNRPSTAQSISDFWRRWHMTLSRWFRDYLYIPLGGNRKGRMRTAVNLFAVFALCGFWHGASWNFLVWGLLHGAFLAIERLYFSNAEKSVGFVQIVATRIYVLGVVLVSWAVFRAETMEQAWAFIRAMVFASEAPLIHAYSLVAMSFDVQLALTIGILFSVAKFPLWFVPCSAKRKSPVGEFAGHVAYLAVFAMSIAYVAADTFNPFIYFRF